MASTQPKIISLINQRKGPSWANPGAHTTSPSARPSSPSARPASPPVQRSASPTARTTSPAPHRSSPVQHGSDLPARDPPMPRQPVNTADDFPSGATKYSGGGTFQRTACTTHKYGVK
eukprot:GGOE01044063.1.p1 GENE.GGOE01044063.1~~GGOE01044063.1.p1  ORF type:complete len:129 (+),score=11.21 GGOE01044063.1:36-389(+)